MSVNHSVRRQAAIARPWLAVGNALAAALLAACIACASGTAAAAEIPYSAAAYQQALAAGKPLVVYFHATWCPTCKVQQPIVDKLSADPQLAAVTVLEADYDKETALKRSLKITQQSTFVVFKGGHEVVRSTGQTDPAVLRALFARAL